MEKVITPTAKEVQMAFVLKSMEYAKSLIISSPVLEVPKEIAEPLLILQEAGMTNSVNYQQLRKTYDEIADKINKNKHTLKVLDFIKTIKKEFGTQTVLVTYSDFLYLLDKYHLICGHLNCYRGNIPLNIAINIAKNKKSKFLVSNKLYFRKISFVSFMNIKNPEVFIKAISVFPFTDKHYWRYSCNDVLKIFNVKLEPKSKEELIDKQIKDAYIELSFDDDEYDDNGVYITRYAGQDLFIAAPAKDMYHVVGFSEKVNLNIPEIKDPFIFFLTEHGVAIIDKWGLEADDEIFNQYENLVKQGLEAFNQPVVTKKTRKKKTIL